MLQYTYTYVCMCAYICMYLCMYVHALTCVLLRYATYYSTSTDLPASRYAVCGLVSITVSESEEAPLSVSCHALRPLSLHCHAAFIPLDWNRSCKAPLPLGTHVCVYVCMYVCVHVVCMYVLHTHVQYVIAVIVCTCLCSFLTAICSVPFLSFAYILKLRIEKPIHVVDNFLDAWTMDR